MRERPGMARIFPADASTRKNIEAWAHSCRDLPTDRFTEVHIDRLSHTYDGSDWISGAVACLEYAADIAAPDEIICAAFELVGESFYRGVNYRSCSELMHEFSLAPPSLYYFGDQAIPWHNKLHPFRRVAIEDFPIDSLRWGLWHLEYSVERECEFRRSLWILPALSSPGADE